MNDHSPKPSAIAGLQRIAIMECFAKHRGGEQTKGQLFMPLKENPWP